MEQQNEKLRSIELDIIPNNIIAKIMRKLPVRAGVRARKTCKFINDLVNKEDIVFAKDDLSYILDVVIHEIANNCELTISYDTPLHSCKIDKFKMEKPDESLRCIVFEEIELHGDWISPSLFDDLSENQFSDSNDGDVSENTLSDHDSSFEFDHWLQEIDDSVFSLFEKLRLKCSLLNTRFISYEDISRFLSSISCLKIQDNTAQPIYNTIDSISQSNCRDLSIFAYEMPLEGVRLHRIRHLEHLQIRGKYPNWRQQFARFLQELHHFDSGKLKTFAIDFAPENATNVFPTNFWPGCRFIWKGTPFSCTDYILPFIVQFSLLETPRNTAVILTKNRYFGGNQHFEINFLEKNDIEGMVYVVFSNLFNYRPIDTSSIYEELKRSDPDKSVPCIPRFPKGLVLPRWLHNGRKRFEFCTDVTSIGLDPPYVNHNVPQCPKTYVHRVGRSARAGRYGSALTFVTQYDVILLQAVEALVGEEMEELKVNEKQVAKYVTKVLVSKREAELKLEQQNFGEKKENNKRKELLMSGMDEGEVDRYMEDLKQRRLNGGKRKIDRLEDKIGSKKKTKITPEDKNKAKK